MNNVLLSTCYFAPIEWFVAAFKAQIITIEAHEHFLKQTWRNRCTILTANGPLDLSIPIVKRSGEKCPITQVEISYDTDWQRVHWNAIVSAYNKSPYFEHYAPEFEGFFTSKPHNLFDLNMQLLHTVFDCFREKREIELSTSFLPIDNTSFNDYRYAISPKIATKMQFREYYQVFEQKFGFVQNLSILDLLFNEGPDGVAYLCSLQIT